MKKSRSIEKPTFLTTRTRPRLVGLFHLHRDGGTDASVPKHGRLWSGTQPDKAGMEEGVSCTFTSLSLAQIGVRTRCGEVVDRGAQPYGWLSLCPFRVRDPARGYSDLRTFGVGDPRTEWRRAGAIGAESTILLGGDRVLQAKPSRAEHGTRQAFALLSSSLLGQNHPFAASRTEWRKAVPGLSGKYIYHLQYNLDAQPATE